LTEFGDVDDLLVLLVERIDSAQCELKSIAETPLPVPDPLRTELEERDALRATLARLVEDDAALRDRAVAIYREEAAKTARGDVACERFPVDAGVLEELAEVEELLRRRRLTFPKLEIALRDANLRSHFAGC
jgi:hypothetical protein